MLKCIGCVPKHHLFSFRQKILSRFTSGILGKKITLKRIKEVFWPFVIAISVDDVVVEATGDAVDVLRLLLLLFLLLLLLLLLTSLLVMQWTGCGVVACVSA